MSIKFIFFLSLMIIDTARVLLNHIAHDKVVPVLNNKHYAMKEYGVMDV
jgi:hypothetical protein